jgi:hypothetical protein
MSASKQPSSQLEIWTHQMSGDDWRLDALIDRFLAFGPLAVCIKQQRLSRAPLLRCLLRFRVDVRLSSPALRERNHDRSHDNKGDDDGKHFKRPCAQELKHG